MKNYENNDEYILWSWFDFYFFSHFHIKLYISYGELWVGLSGK